MRERIKELEKIPYRLTRWIGTTGSLVVHTIIFIACLMLPRFGYDFNKVLLVLTTFLSFEAIYLAIFIQMTVNRSVQSLEEVGEGLEEIQEDVEELSADVDEISADVDEISEDIDKIQEEDVADEAESEKTQVTLEKIETGLQKLLTDIETLKQQK